MLGPSLLFFSPPFCFGYALHSAGRGPAKTAARVGFVLAVVEILFLAVLLLVELFLERG